MVYFKMIVSNNTQMNILVAKDNPLLKEMLKEADVKSLLNNLSDNINSGKNKELNLSNIFKSLFTSIKQNNQTNETVLNILKESNITKDLGSFTKNVNQLLKQLENLPKFNEIKTTLKNFLVDIDKLSTTNIKEQISNSGVFFESKLLNLLNNKNENISLDLKAQLLKLSDELENDSFKQDSLKGDILKQVDKLVNQIEYHQLYSLANLSNSVYIPFLWDLLEDGSIDVKKINDEKFFCKIDLTLKDLGEVDIHLYMFDKKNIDISFFIEKEDTKQLLRENATKLKQMLHKAEIPLQSFEIFSKKEENTNSSKKIDAFKGGDFNFGVDIRV